MGQTAAHALIFGDDFGLERRDGIVRRAQDRAAIEEAEQRGYGAGFAAGQAAQQASDDAQLVGVLQSLALEIARFRADKERFFAACEQESVALATTLASLYGRIVDGIDPHAAFGMAARDVVRRFADASRIVARVPASMRADIDVKLQAFARDARFGGTISVEAAPEAGGAGAFALEWPDGALAFDPRDLEAKLQAEFARYGLIKTEANDHG